MNDAGMTRLEVSGLNSAQLKVGITLLVDCISDSMNMPGAEQMPASLCANARRESTTRLVFIRFQCCNMG
jgi:hypothetical protein